MRLIVNTAQHKALSFDSTCDAHPVTRTEIEDNSDLFGSAAITYYKAASLIRMMDNFLPNGTFLAGITNYLNSK